MCAGGFVSNQVSCLPDHAFQGIINRDGALAEFCVLPSKNLHVVPDELKDEEAVFAEPLAAACRILEQGLLHPGQKIAVIG